jgi:hypothetical protein
VSVISPAIRALVEERAGFRCEYCRLPTRGQVATFPVDHVIARSRGGATEITNLALACPTCNAHEWAKDSATDPVSMTEVSLFNPRSQNWDEHFQWDPINSLVLVGKTPVGRATIELLQMNEPRVITIRRLLAQLEQLQTRERR